MNESTIDQMINREEIQQQCLDFISHAEDSPKYAHQRERAILCTEFEQGQHWTKEQYDRWKEVGIDPITINRCLATVKALSGLYLDNLQDITVVPRKGGSESAARVISEVIKHAQDMGGYDIAAFHAFQKGIIQTASYLFIDIDRTKTANGQIQFTSHGFFDVLVDPDCLEYDIDDKDNGAKYVIRKLYTDKEALAGLYDKYQQSAYEGRTAMDNYIAESTSNSQFYTEEEKTYRDCVYQCFWKKAVPGLLFGDTKTGETKVLTKNLKKYETMAKKSDRFYTEKTVTFELHRSILINGQLMEDKPNPYGENVNFFPCVKYVPIWRDQYERGILDDIVSLNYEENLRRTQVARLLNLTTNSGWLAKEIQDEDAKKELMQFGSVPGYVADKSKFGGELEKIAPNQLSQGHLILAQQSSTDTKEISGVNAAMQGYDQGNKDEPGVVLNLKKQQGEAANSSVFKNFRWSLELLGNKLLSILDGTDVYTEREVRAIVTESHLIDDAMMQKAHDLFQARIGATLPAPQMPPQPGPELWNMVQPEDMHRVYESVRNGIQGAQIYAQQYPVLKQTFDKALRELAIRMLLADLTSGDVTQYGIKVILSPQTETARMKAFAMMMSIHDKYGVIPPDLLLEYSDLPNKDAIIARLRQAAAQPQPQPQAQGAA